MKIAVAKSKVLIVDDFALARLLVRNALAPFHLEIIHTASNGEEALAKIRQAVNEGRPYSIVFSDVTMPGMNGLQLLEACRSDAKTKDLNFVIITAQGEKQSLLSALSSGAVDYIVKPFGEAEFQKKVTRIFQTLEVGKSA